MILQSIRRVVLPGCALVATFTLLCLSRPALASASEVGLGVAAGATLPTGSDLASSPNLNWGFFVDIPLLSTFYISPATILYRMDVDGAEGTESRAATDVELNFKFMIPISRLRLFFGTTQGLTQSHYSADQDMFFHFGFLAGGSYRVLPNIEIFALGQYKLFTNDSSDTRGMHLFVGPIFRF